MSAARRSRNAATNEDVAYVYGVARVAPSGEPAPLKLQGIIPGASVERLVHGNLVAFVSTVPASQFGADELRSGLADAEWLRGRVLAHEKTLEELCSSRGVVPFRFCTIYRNAAEVSAVLARHQVELDLALDRVRGASEWGVKLYCDEEALRRRIETGSTATRKLRETLTGALPGARFFLRKKYDRAVEAEVTSSIAECIDRSRRRLAKYARESVQVEIQAPAEHGRPEAMIMHAAYLVDKGAFAGFQRTLAALQTEFISQGFACELTGPWPAYHFVSSRPEGIEDAAASPRQ